MDNLNHIIITSNKYDNKINYTNFEKRYIKFCEILGIKLFKKFWIAGGSFWGEQHINKNNINDLEIVIENANDFQRTHISQLIIDITFFVLSTKLCLMHRSLGCKIMIVSLTCHSYALIAQNYNKILAKRRIEYLESQQNLNSLNSKNLKHIDKNKYRSTLKNITAPFIVIYGFIMFGILCRISRKKII